MAGEYKMDEKEKLEWLRTVEKMEESRLEESVGGKMRRKIRENPFIPIGMLATTAALSYGVYSMKKGNKRQSQLMMRARIAAQGFTIAALLIGIVVTAKKKKTPD